MPELHCKNYTKNGSSVREKLLEASSMSAPGGHWKGQCHTGAVMHATTILAVRHGGHTVLAGDGQVTLGSNIL